MKNTLGTSVTVTLFGESHGGEIGAVLSGMAPGIPVDETAVAAALSRRRPAADTGTARREPDRFRVVSGVYQGKTTGAPLCIVIENSDVRDGDYASWRGLARPSHADYAAYMKYHGFEDYRGGGQFSGRMTAPLVAVGAVAVSALAAKGIAVGTHVAEVGGVCDRAFGDYAADFKTLLTAPFGMLDGAAAEKAKGVIRAAAETGDSVGGVLETAVTGLPAGVGEPFFDSVESVLSHALFSIPAVKGVAFGAGFDFARMKGSEAGDPWRMQNGRPVTLTNHNGGVTGGITNGMPLLFRTVVKPTPSIYQKQQTVDFLKGENADLQLTGRHDPAVVHRARPVADAVTALALCDLLALRYGTDYLGSAT